MGLKFLKAGTGDSILIQENGCNVLIDGGSEFVHLKNEILEINSLDQKVDLLIITHHDDDHISGIISLLKMIEANDLPKDFIKRIIFNSPRRINGSISEVDDTQLLSYKQAYEAEKLLLKLSYSWELCNEESEPISFAGITLTFLSPHKSDLDDYSVNKGAYLSSDFRCDWKSPMAVLEKFIDDASQDNSLANKTSIVILAEINQKRFLLTGDCTPGRFEAILNKLIKPKEKKVAFDVIKLPHHGSYRSLNKAIVEKILCACFIISTNSAKYYLPNKRAIIKIVKYLKENTGQIEFIFNYESALNALSITKQEQHKYCIKLTPNNKPYGISL